MNDVEFSITAIERFQTDTRRFKESLQSLNEDISKALLRVTETWKDESVILAGNKLDVVIPRINVACDELCEIVDRVLRNQIEWAHEYSSIR